MSGYDVIIVGAGPSGSTAAKLLADSGHTVLLVDKKEFPRKKICAAWVNAAAPQTFPHISEALGSPGGQPFYGLDFLHSDLSQKAWYVQEEPAGYLVSRGDFDARLKDIALNAGVEFRDGAELTGLSDLNGAVKAEIDYEQFTAKFLIGADGVNSAVARFSGLNEKWINDQLVICVNEDIPCDAARITEFFGDKPRIIISPGYGVISGYGWVFPKRDHICVGIGGGVPNTKNVHIIFNNFFNDLKKGGHIPAEINWEDDETAMNPAGAAARLNPDQAIARGRVLLVGDAGGFSVGHSGEGIYPGMLSAREAASAVSRVIEGRDADAAAAYTAACEKNLYPLIAGIDGATMMMITQMVYSAPKVAEKAARSFLFGEPFKL